MDVQAGPYPVQTYDHDYQAVVGWFEGMGYWFRVLDERGEEVDSGGLLSELTHLKELLEATYALVQWQNERAIVDALRPYDDALNSVLPGVQELLLAS